MDHDNMESTIRIGPSTEYWRSISPVNTHDRRSEKEYDEFMSLARVVIGDTANDVVKAYVLQPFVGWEIGGGGGGPDLPVLILTFASGAVTALLPSLVQLVTAFLSKDQAREITVERGGDKITIKGTSRHEAMELLRLVFPELFGDKEGATQMLAKWLSESRPDETTRGEDEKD
jgi:hypothetical protein